MPRRRILLFATLALAATLLGCESGQPSSPTAPGEDADRSQPSTAKGTPTQFARLIALPTLSGRTAEALAVNGSGVDIVGYAWERRGTMRAAKWRLQSDGSWAITALPHATAATGAIARGVNRAGDVAGNDFPESTAHAVLWPATGGFSVLGCNDLGEVFGVSTDAQVLVGVARRAGQLSTAALWKPGTCREDLPPLVANGWSRADAVNKDGTIAGGTAGGPAGTSVPVRWRRIAGAWQIEQLDQRSGFVYGANAAGDLAGYVVNGCGDDGGCQRAVVWYVLGGFRELGTLGGADSWGRGINAAGEVVGVSTRSDGINTGFLWTESAGMVELPRNSRWAAANAISDGRSDGTRVAVGMSSSAVPVAWVIRNP